MEQAQPLESEQSERTREPIVLVANPHAGRGKGAKALSRVQERLSARGAELQVRPTTRPGEAVEIAQAAAEEGAGLVVAVGGDGTLHEVLGGVLESERRPLLGIVPVGGGNDYARMLGIPRDPGEAAELLLGGSPRPVDVGRLEGADQGPEHFLNNVGLAYMGEANAARESTRFLPGSASYLAAGLLAAVLHERQEFRLTVDGTACSGRFFIIHVGIGLYCGAGVSLTPGAQPDDGQFAVYLLDDRSRLVTALQWSRIARGELVAGAGRQAGSRVRIEGPRGFVLHVDGEIRRSPQGLIDLTILPREVSVVA